MAGCHSRSELELRSPFLADSIKQAEERLRGTVWAHSCLACFAYLGCLVLGRKIARLGVGASAVTSVSLGFAVLAGLLCGFGDFMAASLCLALSGVCDLLDGVVARETRTASRYGALLDSTVDRVADGAPMLGLVVWFAGDAWYSLVPALTMLGGFVVSYVRARAAALGAELPPLLMQRAERLVLLLLSLVLGGVRLGGVPAPLLLGGVGLIGLLSFVGVGRALYVARLELEQKPGARSSEPGGELGSRSQPAE